jgi:hypothetical protein
MGNLNFVFAFVAAFAVGSSALRDRFYKMLLRPKIF